MEPLEAETATMTPERQELLQRGLDARLISVWDAFSDITKPTTTVYLPYVWRWARVEPILRRAGELVTLDEADRRALVLANPGVFPKYFTTNTMYAAYQFVAPGESAAVHSHTLSASRFILEGNGGFTVVEGEKCPMSRGDLILTPQGAWHDHGNDGDSPAVWVDVLDVPLLDHMGATYFDFDYGESDDPRGEPIRQRTQTVRWPLDHSGNLYGATGLLPAFVSHQRGKGKGTPRYIYPWTETMQALDRLKSYEGSPFDGILLRYVDPTNGTPVSPTMDFAVQMLRPGEKTARHRHTSSTVYCCLEGSGRTVVGQTVLEWERNDIFVVPTWAWHHHENHNTGGPAILYAVTDEPAARKLELYREESAPERA